MCAVTNDLARTIGGSDAELKAELLMACVAGMTLARYLLELPALAQAGREDIERLMGPALRAVLDGE
jgi:hypothetical protein